MACKPDTPAREETARAEKKTGLSLLANRMKETVIKKRGFLQSWKNLRDHCLMTKGSTEVRFVDQMISITAPCRMHIFLIHFH